MKKRSIQFKYTFLFLITAFMIAGALFVGLKDFRTVMLRHEAQAVAAQVVSFRSWVARSGMVWVDSLSEGFHDFLAKRPDDAGGHFYGKNPALATRELSTIVNKSSFRATFRVTSDDYRHPDNKPDSFETAAIAELRADNDREFMDAFRGGFYRYAQPIFVKKVCLKCHGDPKDAPPEVIEKYGDKNAFGYEVGDVRGVISVTIPDIKIEQILPTLANPITIGLLVLTFLFNFVFVQRSIIRRLRNLTRNAETIAKGDFDTKLQYRSPEKSNDEIDHTSHAVDLLRNSLQISMRRLRRNKG